MCASTLEQRQSSVMIEKYTGFSFVKKGHFCEKPVRTHLCQSNLD